MELEEKGGEEEAPVSPESEESPAPGEEAAPEGEKPEAGEDDQDTGEGTGDEGGEGSSEEGRGGAFDKLLAKYGGDKDKMASAYFEQATSNARLAERLQAIEQYIQGQQKEPEVDEAKLVEADPDVKEIVQRYNDTLSEARTTETQQNQLISKYGQLERQIEKMRGKLEATQDPEVKQEVRADLGELVAEQKGLSAEIRGTQSDIKRLNQELRDLTRDYRKAEVQAKEGVSRRRREALEHRQEAIATRQEFAEAMRTEATKHGIPVESREYAVLFQSVHDRIYTYLSRLPEGAPGIDISGAVQALMAEYKDSFLKDKFKKASAAKREASSPFPQLGEAKGEKEPAAKPKGDVLPPKDGRWTAQFVRERAKRLLG